MTVPMFCPLLHKTDGVIFSFAAAVCMAVPGPAFLAVHNDRTFSCRQVRIAVGMAGPAMWRFSPAAAETHDSKRNFNT